MTLDPKPLLGPAGIRANIQHLEARVQNAYDNWQKEINELQHWLDELDKLETADEQQSVN